MASVPRLGCEISGRRSCASAGGSCLGLGRVSNDGSCLGGCLVTSGNLGMPIGSICRGTTGVLLCPSPGGGVGWGAGFTGGAGGGGANFCSSESCAPSALGRVLGVSGGTRGATRSGEHTSEIQ